MVTNVAVPVPAPVVTTKTKVSLADHMDLRNLPLATTPGGRAFAMKNLHPADSEIKAVRAPGGLVPTLAVSYDTVDTIPFPPDAVSACFMQTPNPAFPVSLVFKTATGETVDFYLWSNSALGGKGVLHHPSTLAEIVDPWLDFADKLDAYRVLAQSITCDVIAPAVADQGTIVSAQYVDRPFTFNPSFLRADSLQPSQSWPESIWCAATDFWAYDKPPGPEALLMGTSAYTAKAREGFYQPLKIDQFKYQSADDGFWPVEAPSKQALARFDNISTRLGDYPIYFHHFASTTPNAHPIPRPSGYAVGMTWIEGTAGNPQVSLRIRVRQVTEIIPCLGSIYAPLAEAPLPPDELAYKMIREIGAKLKDGYPASYNDWGKLKDTIGKIGRSVLKYADPALDVISAVPGLGAVGSAAKLGKQFLTGIQQIYDAPRKAAPQPGTSAAQAAPAPSKTSKKRKRKPKAKKSA